MAFREERRSRLSFKRSEEAGSAGVSAVDPEPVGEQAGDGIAPAILQGTHFRGTPDVPDFVVAGRPFAISGTQHYDNSLALSVPSQRTRLDVAFEADPLLQNHGQLQHCNTSGFFFELVAPQAVGQSFSVELRAQQFSEVDGWITRDRFGPVDVDVVTEEEAQRRRIMQWVPWVGVGGVGGAVVAPAFGRSQARGVVLGAAAGAGAKFLADEVDLPSVGTTEVLAAAALFGTAAFFLSQARGTARDVAQIAPT